MLVVDPDHLCGTQQHTVAIWISAVLGSLCCVLFPICMLIRLVLARDRLDGEQLDSRYGCFYRKFLPDNAGPTANASSSSSIHKADAPVQPDSTPSQNEKFPDVYLLTVRWPAVYFLLLGALSDVPQAADMSV